MHGRPRKPYGYVEDPEKAALKAKKLEQFKQLTDWVYKKIECREYDQAFLEKSGQLLQQNPDVYTIWNHRKIALQDILVGNDRDLASSTAASELAVTEKSLNENPKSYSAWHHRMWIIKKGFSSPKDEIKQMNRVLQMDSRNFVAWHYRRQMVKLAGIDPEEELQYSRDLIDKNFSNYSAWHNRTEVLKSEQLTNQVVSMEDLVAGHSADRDIPLPPERLAEEYELVQQAFFTDPEDQSAYIYHRWLLNESMSHYKSLCGTDREAGARQVIEDTLQREEERCRELIEIEPERFRLKWPLLTLCLLLKFQRQVKDFDPMPELRSLYSELADIDPLRKGFYQDAIDLAGL